MPAKAGIHLPTVQLGVRQEMDPSFRWGDGKGGYPLGLSAVNSEQQGFVTGLNSISSARVPSGS